MKIILITGEDLGHRYVANKLALEIPLSGIIVDQGLGGHGRWRKLWRRYTIGQLLSRACLRCLGMARRDQYHKRSGTIEVLGMKDSIEFLTPHIVTRVRGINSKEGLGAVSSFNPDVILIFGTSVVREGVLCSARIIALNLHTGISPFYRGADCSFWPIYNNELNMLGATIHECTMQLDGGRIFATQKVCLEANDNLYSVAARCVKAGADLYVKVVKELMTSRRLEGSLQDLTVGSEYKAVSRNVRADLKARREIKKGLIRRYVLANGPDADEPIVQSRSITK